MADPFIAEIVMFGGNFAPRGWAFCDGQLLQISSNTALFSILGTTYGGDGRTTFALPDLRGRFAMHAGNGPMVLCESDDTGSLVVSADIVAAFLEDQTQWPTYQLSRFDRDTASVGDGLHVALETLSTEYCFILP